MSKRNSSIHSNYVSYWLLYTAILVAIIIIVGGLTRLTDSGLSITKWDLFSGILPPLSSYDWEEYFNLYKQTAEFKLQNLSMSINDFKIIYWWEYIHRLLGRLVGIFYFFPLLFFTFKKLIKKDFLVSFYSIFVLILIQGFIGWYMVKSGLIERTDVSHYRLSLHLTLAFIIFILLLWNYFKYRNQKNFVKHKKLPYFLSHIFFFFILIQISIGALVSGLDAGQIYTTWPLMNDNYFPDDTNIRSLFSTTLFEVASLVQFIHRNLAYTIIFLFLIISAIVYRDNDLIYLRRIVLLIFILLFVQTFLGILTVLSGAQIILASMHQIGSIFLITASLILVFKNSKTN